MLTDSAGQEFRQRGQLVSALCRLDPPREDSEAGG